MAKQLNTNKRDYSAFMRKYGVILVLLLMVVLLSIVSPVFMTVSNIISVLLQVAINGILALGMVFVITAGGIDLSIGSMLALAGSIVGAMLTANVNQIPLACLASVAACTAIPSL